MARLAPLDRGLRLLQVHRECVDQRLRVLQQQRDTIQDAIELLESVRPAKKSTPMAMVPELKRGWL